MNFEEVLAEFSGAIGTPLAVDENSSCLLILDDGLHVQIEPARNDILIGITLGSVPAGPTLEPFFRKALVENGLPPPRHGTLAWSRKSGELILFAFHPSQNGEELAAHFRAMVGKARRWRDALQRGELPLIEEREEQ